MRRPSASQPAFFLDNNPRSNAWHVLDYMSDEHKTSHSHSLFPATTAVEFYYVHAAEHSSSSPTRVHRSTDRMASLNQPKRLHARASHVLPPKTARISDCANTCRLVYLRLTAVYVKQPIFMRTKSFPCHSPEIERFASPSTRRAGFSVLEKSCSPRQDLAWQIAHQALDTGWSRLPMVYLFVREAKMRLAQKVVPGRMRP